MLSPKCSQPPCMNIEVSSVDQAGTAAISARSSPRRRGARDHPELEDGDLPLLFPEGGLPEKNKNAGADDAPGDDRRADTRIIVGDGEHASCVLALTPTLPTEKTKRERHSPTQHH